MKEYIERASLMGALTSGTEQLAMREMTGAEAYAEFVRLVNFAPAANVVEVTFCKDCRYYQDAKVNEKGFLICPASGMEITETDYCSYGALVDGKKTPSCHNGVCEIPGVEREDDYVE